MNVHKNARLTPRGREVLVSRLERGEHPRDVGTAMGVSASTAYKWRRRYRAEGLAGLLDRSSRPNTSPNRTPDDVETKVIVLRKQRRIYHRIAAEPDRVPPDIHIFTSSKQSWITLPPEIPAVAEYYDRNEYWPEKSLARRRAVAGPDVARK